MASTITALTSGGGLAMAGDTSGQLQLLTNNGTAAVTIDTSQNVGIGTTSPSSQLFLSGSNDGVSATVHLKNTGASGHDFAITSRSDGSLRFTDDTAAAERMRIDSSGNLLVGTTSVLVASNPAPVLNVVGGGTNYATMYQRNTATTAGKFWRCGVDAGNSWNFYNQSGTGVYLLDGGIAWAATSDETKKENLTPILDALNKVTSLRSVMGNYIDDPEKQSHPFLIAQDVQKVLPEAVSEKEGVLGLQYTDLIPLLVASIKELNTKVEAQALEIKALKGVA